MSSSGNLNIRSLCIFAGSNSGNDAIYKSAAEEIGALLAKEKITMVYGGSCLGLMGIMANTVLSKGGRVVGVIPKFLEVKEVSHRSLTELYVVNSMSERKQMMFDLSDAFMSLPGGYGTLDEMTEVLTWAQLGLHSKPSGLLNINGFYDALLQQLQKAEGLGFMRSQHLELLLSDKDPQALLTKFRHYKAPIVEKWIDRNQV